MEETTWIDAAAAASARTRQMMYPGAHTPPPTTRSYAARATMVNCAALPELCNQRMSNAPPTLLSFSSSIDSLTTDIAVEEDGYNDLRQRGVSDQLGLDWIQSSPCTCVCVHRRAVTIYRGGSFSSIIFLSIAAVNGEGFGRAVMHA